MGRRLWAAREDFVAGVTHHAYRQLRQEMGLPPNRTPRAIVSRGVSLWAPLKS
jgi:hypothetical protein